MMDEFHTRMSLSRILTGQQSIMAELMQLPWQALDQDEDEEYDKAR